MLLPKTRALFKWKKIWNRFNGNILWPIFDTLISFKCYARKKNIWPGAEECGKMGFFFHFFLLLKKIHLIYVPMTASFCHPIVCLCRSLFIYFCFFSVSVSFFLVLFFVRYCDLRRSAPFNLNGNVQFALTPQKFEAFQKILIMDGFFFRFCCFVPFFHLFALDDVSWCSLLLSVISMCREWNEWEKNHNSIESISIFVCHSLAPSAATPRYVS